MGTSRKNAFSKIHVACSINFIEYNLSVLTWSYLFSLTLILKNTVYNNHHNNMKLLFRFKRHEVIFISNKNCIHPFYLYCICSVRYSFTYFFVDLGLRSDKSEVDRNEDSAFSAFSTFVFSQQKQQCRQLKQQQRY